MASSHNVVKEMLKLPKQFLLQPGYIFFTTCFLQVYILLISVKLLFEISLVAKLNYHYNCFVIFLH